MPVILDSKIRINRNIKNFKFPARISKKDSDIIVDKVWDIVLPMGYEKKYIKDFSDIKKLELFEEEIITDDLLKNINKSAVFLKEGSPSILVNEIDHIVIQDERDTLDLDESYKLCKGIEEILSTNVDYSFNDDFGFLTSEIMSCGMGLVPSVTVHIPGISYFGVESLVERLNKLGYEIKGLYLKNGKVVGNLYKIYPSRSIGLSEESLIEKLKNILLEVMSMEKEKRKKIYFSDLVELEDIVNRSYGILKYAKRMQEEEMIFHLSNICLGVELSVIKANVDFDIMESIKNLRSGHIQIEYGSILDIKSIDILRANKVRKWIKEVFE